MSTSQRHTRLNPGRVVRQANGAAIHSKPPGSCQHKIVEFWRNGSNSSEEMEATWEHGALQAGCGCLVGHVCMGVRISVFAPYLCNTSVSGLDEYANGCRIWKGANIYPFFVFVEALGGGLGRCGFLRRSTPTFTWHGTSTSFLFGPPEGTPKINDHVWLNYTVYDIWYTCSGRPYLHTYIVLPKTLSFRLARTYM